MCKPFLSDKYIQFSTISLVGHENVIFDSELAKTFNSYFEKTVVELGIKYENFDMNSPYSRSQDGVSVLLLLNTETTQVSK